MYRRVHLAAALAAFLLFALSPSWPGSPPGGFGAVPTAPAFGPAPAAAQEATAGQFGPEAKAPPTYPDAPPAAEGRLTLDRYLDFRGVAGPRISPDGDQIVYTLRWIDPVTDGRKSSLRIMEADGSRSRHLTDGSSPRWSPSGDRIAFLACGTAGGDRSALEDCPPGANRQIWVRHMDDEGAVTQVTRLTQDASSIAWSPDGGRIAFNKLVPEKKRWDVDMPPRPEGAQWTEEPRVVERMTYRRDGRGFLPEGHVHVFTVDAEGGPPRQITHGDYDHGSPEWTPDGGTILFDGHRHPEADWIWRASHIYAVDVGSREIRQLTERRGPDRNPTVSPDGRHVAYVGHDSVRNTYITDRLYVMEVDGSAPRLLTGEFDRAPRRVRWAPGGDGLYFVAEDEGRMNVHFASLDGTVRQVTEGDHEIYLSDIDGDRTAVGVLTSPAVPEDVVAIDLRRPDRLQRLTRVNADLLADVELGQVEEFWYESFDGLEIQGWIIHPPGFDPSREYPLVMHIHGGPHAMYGFDFTYAFQNWAAEDYVVLYTNPRGSSGYGTEFGNAIMNAYPGDDYHDLMAGVDEVLDRGYVDADNLFVTGCSGGGVLTAWIVGQTDRFAAASSRCPVVNWMSFVGTTDGPFWYRNFEHLPWEDPSEHLERSPLMHVGNVTTPTMLMTGVNDLRTPMAQTEEYYQALKFRQVPTAMIRVKDEWHGTGRQPSNFLRTQAYQMHWFERFMTEEMRERRERWKEERAGR